MEKFEIDEAYWTETDGDDCCDAVDGGWLCTRTINHTGPHVADVARGDIVHVWV